MMEQNILKILFIDDSQDDVELTLSELHRGGYQVRAHCVETADSMQNAIDSQTWDVIISDYKLPQFSAEMSLALYNKNALDIPFIIISGVVEAEDVVYLLKQGAHDFLNKNSLARLVPAIERELRETETHRAQKYAEQRISILSLALEQSPIAVVIVKPDGIIEYVNPKFQLTSGYKEQEAIGKPFGFTISTNNGKTFDTNELWHCIRKQMHWEGEVCSRHRDGGVYWECINVSPLEDENGDLIRFVSVQEDITIRRSYDEQLRIQAHHDDLTGLANRTLMMSELMKAVEYSGANNISTALLCIDLDHFKNINDTMGHIIGDQLLIQAASRLAACTKRQDTLARMGGDEFLIILPRIEDNILIQQVADRILRQFAEPFVINGQEHFVSASIGVAKYPENSTDPQVLLRNADLAMYQAKSMGRNQCCFFSQEIDEKFQQKVAISSALRGVESRNELELFYQPIIDSRTHKIVSCEALIRWKTGGQYIVPDVFIPVAEETGLINQVGKWVIDKACEDLQHIHNDINSDLKLAVNISPNQLQSIEFSSLVKEKLQSCNIDSHMLELEITESVLINDLHAVNQNLYALCDMGFHLSIDDFGTGYSSLAYLQKYPFSTLKVDRSFVSQIENNKNNAKLIETMIAMAHNLGMKVVAEGVETSEQLAFLSQCQCELMQGYFFSRPVPLEKLIASLRAQKHTPPSPSILMAK